MKINLSEEESFVALFFVGLSTLSGLAAVTNIIPSINPLLHFMSAFGGSLVLIQFFVSLRRENKRRMKEILEGPLKKEEVIEYIRRLPNFNILKRDKDALKKEIITLSKEDNIYFEGMNHDDSLNSLINSIDTIVRYPEMEQ